MSVSFLADGKTPSPKPPPTPKQLPKTKPMKIPERKTSFSTGKACYEEVAHLLDGVSQQNIRQLHKNLRRAENLIDSTEQVWSTANYGTSVSTGERMEECKTQTKQRVQAAQKRVAAEEPEEELEFDENETPKQNTDGETFHLDWD